MADRTESGTQADRSDIASNTMTPFGNPFSTGSSDDLVKIVVSLMDDTDGAGLSWKIRATAMLTGVLRALTWMRDAGMITLDAVVLRDHLRLERIIEISDPELYPSMPEPVRRSVRSYLTSLPGYDEEKGHEQGQVTRDQHGFLEMHFSGPLGALA